jgi:hypothetical protein
MISVMPALRRARQTVAIAGTGTVSIAVMSGAVM